ncbi:MAG TPA: hypothetical protein VGD67_18105 [Pseudonocardiaceae bacterium]
MAGLLAFQRSVGNAAVVRSLQRQPRSVAAPPADLALVRREVNGYGDQCFQAQRAAFATAIGAFRNWYFDQDEGDEALFTDLKRVVGDAGPADGRPVAPALREAFTAAAKELQTSRFEFLTSFARVISTFSARLSSEVQGQTARLVEQDTAAWQDITARQQAGGDWKPMLHDHGLPRTTDDLSQRLLGELMFSYRKWELAQHTDMYRGIYSMTDPDLKLMRADAQGEARRLLSSPTMNYGDVTLPVGTFTVKEGRIVPLLERASAVEASVRLPLFDAVGVSISGQLSGGVGADLAIDPIMLSDVRVGLNYRDFPAVARLLSGLMSIDGLGALRLLSGLYGLRLRGAGVLTAGAGTTARLFVEAVLKLAADVGVSDLTVDLASVEGALRASASARFSARYRKVVDIIVDHGRLSFAGAESKHLSEDLEFGINGRVGARILTLGFSKSWDIATWSSGRAWETNSDLNLLYVNGIQGDPDKVVDLTRLRAVLSQLRDLGGQMMHLGPPGATTTAAPKPSAPLDLRWPKPVAAGYPRVYLTHRGETRSQHELRERFREGAPHIREYSPLVTRRLPHSSEEIGLDPYNQLGADNPYVGPLTNNTTPSGDKINRLLGPYGVQPTVLNGDHVREIQLGGDDEVNNLWPLPAAFNQAAGSRLNHATVVDTTTTPPQTFKITVLKNLIKTYPANYFFRIVSFDPSDFR